jgi:predicted dehydrogenase
MFGNGLRGKHYGWLFDVDRAGGWIGAYGAHVIDTIRWWTGDEVARCGGMSRVEVSTRPGQAGVLQSCTAEDGFTIWALMEGGVTLGFDSAFSASVNLPERVVLFGSDGALELVSDRELVLRRPDGSDNALELEGLGPDTYAQAMDPWVVTVRNALCGGATVAPGFDDGVANTEVLDALRVAVLRA